MSHSTPNQMGWQEMIKFISEPQNITKYLSFNTIWKICLLQDTFSKFSITFLMSRICEFWYKNSIICKRCSFVSRFWEKSYFFYLVIAPIKFCIIFHFSNKWKCLYGQQKLNILYKISKLERKSIPVSKFNIKYLFFVVLQKY